MTMNTEAQAVVAEPKHLAISRSGSDYVYRPLSPRGDEIRILELLPADNFSATIRVRLRTVSFAEDAQLQYEALSYVWGTTQNQATVLVADDDSSDFRSLHVTRNCEEALTYLRNSPRGRMFWVDAICINQGDQEIALRERAHQVAMMSKIYSRATRVNAWLGSTRLDVDLAFAWIEVLSRHLSIHPISGELIGKSSDPWCTEWGSDARISVDEIKSFSSLLDRGYFDRLWVWQEVKFGGVRTWLLAAHLEINWYQFAAAVGYLFGASLPHFDGDDQFIQRLEMLRGLNDPRHGRLLRTLDILRSCQCSNERDRIFAAQSFAADTRLIIPPDYMRPTADTWIDATRNYIEVCQDLECLLYVQRLSSRSSSLSLPSWAPDWSQRRPTARLAWRLASCGIQCSVIMEKRRQLRVWGVMVGLVTEVSSFGADAESVALSSEEFDSKIEFMLRSMFDTKKPPRACLQPLCEVLLRGRTSDTTINSPHIVPSLKDMEEFLLQVPSVESATGTSVARQATYSYCLGRALLQTDDQRFALGPELSRPGDIIAILIGCSSAIVLRPTMDNMYQVIGDAYCQGYMNGEALLGPLPESWEGVEVYNNERGTKRIVFRNQHTGEIQSIDPREALIPLPEGWEIREDGSGVEYFYEPRSGESRSLRRDPRFDPEELLKRGVKLREFTLV